MLEAAGVPLSGADSPCVDEAAARDSLMAQSARPERAAETLAELKARGVSYWHPGALVIGADQILETADGEWLEKPNGRADARAQIARLSGTTHRLFSAVVLVRHGERIWHSVDSARLTMRPLSDAFLDAYLDAVGDAVTSSVGGYQVEGPGVQLFSAITGNHFTILGLPLLPLLDVLRAHGILRV